MSIIFSSRTILILTCAAAAALTCACYSVARSEDKGNLPEFFLTSMNHPYCVMRIEVPGDNVQRRERAFLEFVDKGYAATSGWANQFIPIGVDYDSFEYFRLVFFEGCSPKNTNVIEHQVAAWLGAVPKVRQEAGSHLVDSAEKRLSFKDTAAFFRAYKQGYTVTECAIRVTEIDNDEHNAGVIHNTFAKIWAKYRVSIAELWQVNKYTYVIFSRQCEKKDILYRRLLDFSRREGVPLIGMLSPPDLRPDLKEYFLSH